MSFQHLNQNVSKKSSFKQNVATCNFQSAATPYAGGNGIFSVDAIYTVDKYNGTPCVFDNLSKGIFVNNINPLKTPLISNATFTNNWYGAYFMNANYIVFQTNTLTCSSRAGASEVYLNNCKYYKIKNNEFSHITGYGSGEEGVSVYKSKIGAHEIFRNTFSNLSIGINCMDDNGNPTNSTDGLKMNCNDFHVTPNYYDVVLSYSSGLALPLVNKTQGNVSTGALAQELVRNIYGANCGNQNKWQIYSGSTVTINHGANTNTTTTVTQPTATGYKSLYLNVVDKSIPLDYPNHCPAYPPSSGGSSTLSANRLASINEYISGLTDQRASDIGAGLEPNDFELQSSVASKLNLFLTDSVVNNADSVIAILENNQGYMEDADIQTVFAYMNKGDYINAADYIEALDTSRFEWKELLTHVLNLQQDSVFGLDSITTPYSDFFSTYATSTDMDGKALAQAVLMACSFSEYTEPHALPEGVSSARIKNNQTAQNIDVLAETGSKISIYPNPTNTGINVNYNSDEGGTVMIELKDLLGRVIYTNFISTQQMNQYISMVDLKSGMYLLSLTRDKELIYSAKIIKQD